MNDLPPSSPTPRNQPLAALRSSEPGSPAADEVSLQTKASIKPRAAFLLPQESFDAVYGVVARTELEHLMTFVIRPPEASIRQILPSTTVTSKPFSPVGTRPLSMAEYWTDFPRCASSFTPVDR
jgi:hypothetical protein